MFPAQCNVGLVGAGYIAEYHARVLAGIPGVRLVAVADTNHAHAAAFAARHKIRGVYDSAEMMLRNEMLQVVHVLTPPDHHSGAAEIALKVGVHVLLEKPMCADLASCERLLAHAEARNLRVGVNHNFLFHPAYERLRDDVRGGYVGALENITITWALELPQLRTGGNDMWALRHPANIMYEIGAHAISQMLDLAAVPDSLAVYPSQEVHLPDGRLFYLNWQVLGWCGRVSVDLRFSFAPGFADRSIQVRGNLGVASADMERNTYTLQRHGRHPQDFGKYEVITNTARDLQTQARENLLNYVLSKLSRRRQGSAFAASMAAGIRAFYEGLGGIMDPRCGGQMGRLVVEQCGRVAGLTRIESRVSRLSRFTPGEQDRADVLVLGGTGFVGRELVQQLLKSGRVVRVMTRSRASAPFDPEQPGLQIVTGDIRNEADVVHALRNVDKVVHLARAPGGSWEDYYQQDVLGTQMLARHCLDQNVRRMVYASSIVIYNTGGRGPITEATSFDRAICQQNKYARAKAEAEQRLIALHRSDDLPVVVVRPGMVIGKGGDLCHGGVGAWNGPGSCVLWGRGRSKLPFVLVEDVAQGLIAALDAGGIEGESFNLVADQCLSAQEYVEEIERFAGWKISLYSQPVWRAYMTDVFKWLAKIALRMPDRCVPRYGVWRSRTASAVFDCSKAKELLGWRPSNDRNLLVARGIHVHLIDAAQAGRPASEFGSAVQDGAELNHAAY